MEWVARSELLGVGYDASDITDRILEGIETYVTTTTDFEYAKEIVENFAQLMEMDSARYAKQRKFYG